MIYKFLSGSEFRLTALVSCTKAFILSVPILCLDSVDRLRSTAEPTASPRNPTRTHEITFRKWTAIRLIHEFRVNPRYSGATGRLIIWRLRLSNDLVPPSNRYSLNFFDLWRGWRIFLTARPQILDNIRRNSLACENLSVLAVYFVLLW